MYVHLFLVCFLSMRPSRVVGATSLWENLGKPRFIAAPMVDHSSLPWRVFLHQQGRCLEGRGGMGLDGLDGVGVTVSCAFGSGL